MPALPDPLLAAAGAYAGMSVAALAVYARDKRAARRGGRRTPEATLHLLELLGGWPGALLAQRWLRHKNAKPGYQAAFWAIVALHLGAWGWWVLR